MTTIAEYIKKHGATKIAAKLNVTEQCVRNWEEYRYSPQTEKMMELVKLSKGKLSYQGIIEPFVRNKVKNKNK